MDIVSVVTVSLKHNPAVRKVELVGSRKMGTATQWSDWDFAVETTDFEIVSAALPGLVRSLEPISYLWDPLGDCRVFMLILKGPVKVDLIFDIPHPHDPPWTVNSDTLMVIDHHFWDWILWIAVKDIRGLKDYVRTELQKMHAFLLQPLGVKEVPDSIPSAIQAYETAFQNQVNLFRRQIDPALQEEVLKGLRMMGYQV
jgi:predicted nucleotidyltransferase